MRIILIMATLRNDGNLFYTLPGKKEILKLIWVYLQRAHPTESELAEIEKAPTEQSPQIPPPIQTPAQTAQTSSVFSKIKRRLSGSKLDN